MSELNLSSPQAPEYNIPLFRKTLEYVEGNPHEWDQDVWASVTPCGTTRCFAGTAAWLAGATMKLDRHGSAESCIRPDGLESGIDSYAMEQLGLSNSQAEWIFYSDAQNPEELRELVEDVIGQKL